jgi:hypothetical protein
VPTLGTVAGFGLAWKGAFTFAAGVCLSGTAAAALVFGRTGTGVGSGVPALNDSDRSLEGRGFPFPLRVGEVGGGGGSMAGGGGGGGETTQLEKRSSGST